MELNALNNYIDKEERFLCLFFHNSDINLPQDFFNRFNKISDCI